jgi:hypothetical protein
MNTSIISTNENASLLLSLLTTYNSIDISQLVKITGSSTDIMSIANSTKFEGFGLQHFSLTDQIDNDTLLILEERTSGRIIELS